MTMFLNSANKHFSSKFIFVWQNEMQNLQTSTTEAILKHATFAP